MKNLQGKIKKTLLSTVIALTLGTVATQQIVLAGNQSNVNIDSSSLSFAANTSESRLELSIAGPGMDVVSVRGTSSVFWNIPSDIADGSYNYELTVVTPSADGKEESSSAERVHGSFEVSNGVINDEPEEVIQGEDGADDISGISGVFKGVGIALLDFIIPSANAANLTADNPTNPFVLYKEGGVNKWLTQSMSVAPYAGSFRKRSYGNGKTVELLQENSHFLTHNSGSHWFLKTADVSPNYAGTAPVYISIHKDANNVLVGGTGGNVHLADSTVFIDKANNRVGIGTTTPTENLEIASSSPTIVLNDTNGDTKWTFNKNTSGSLFDIGASTSAIPYSRKFYIREGAGQDSLAIGENGVGIGGGVGSIVNLGIGTNSPSSSLHIKRSGAILKVEDTNTTYGIRNLLEMHNKGPVGFKLKDTSTSDEWAFRSGGGGSFLVSKTGVSGPLISLSDSGSVSMGLNVASGSTASNMILSSSGDLTIKGSFITPLNTYADYVFDDDYKLLPLDELQVFVKKEKHLPNVLSEAEVKKTNSINVSKLQMKQLEKIEELTLYTLQQHKQIKALQNRVAENTKMKERLASLEKMVTNFVSTNEALKSKAEIFVLNK